MAYKSKHTGAKIDEAVASVLEKASSWDKKQDAINGEAGQLVGFDADGKPSAISYSLSQFASNPNMLHNWYFANPVNQRGLTEYPSGVREYTIDRWVKSSGITMSIGNGCVTLTNISASSRNSFMHMICQNIESGAQVTASCLTTDGQLYYGTTTMPAYGNRYNTFCAMADQTYLRIYSAGDDGTFDRLLFYIPAGSTIELVAVKLELGDVQTLAHQDANGNWALNEIPDYNEELLKCVQSTADPADEYANQVVYHTGNKPTAEEVGAAPSGFGLGTAAKDISGKDSSARSNLIDTLKSGKSGWYRGRYVENSPTPDSWCYFHVITDSVDYSVVLAYPMRGGEYRALYETGTLYNWQQTSVTTHKHETNDVSFSVADDLFALTKTCTVQYAANTANTPYAAGLTSYGTGICHAFVGASTRSLLCMTAAGVIYTQRYYDSQWRGWVKHYSEYSKPTAVDIGLINPNLLRNWCFINPVQHRGKGPFSKAGHTVDGWYLGNSYLQVDVESDGLKFERLASGDFSNLRQIIKGLPAGTYTLSALFRNIDTSSVGIYAYKTNEGFKLSTSNREAIASSGTDLLLTKTFNHIPTEDLDYLVLCFGTPSGSTVGGTFKLVAAKLEFGPTQTLAYQSGTDENGKPIWALYETPDYNEELLKCAQSTADPNDTYANKVIYHTGNKPTSQELFGYPTNADFFSVPTALAAISEVDFMTKTITTSEFFQRMQAVSAVSGLVSKEMEITLSDLPGYGGAFTAWKVNGTLGFGLFQDYSGKLYRYNWAYSAISGALVGWEEVLHTGTSNKSTVMVLGENEEKPTPQNNNEIYWFAQ